MSGLSLLWQVYLLLPVVFALDVAAFHVTGDHPLAARWWWGRSRRRTQGEADEGTRTLDLLHGKQTL